MFPRQVASTGTSLRHPGSRKLIRIFLPRPVDETTGILPSPPNIPIIKNATSTYESLSRDSPWLPLGHVCNLYRFLKKHTETPVVRFRSPDLGNRARLDRNSRTHRRTACSEPAVASNQVTYYPDRFMLSDKLGHSGSAMNPPAWGFPTSTITTISTLSPARSNN